MQAVGDFGVARFMHNKETKELVVMKCTEQGHVETSRIWVVLAKQKAVGCLNHTRKF